MRYVYTSQWKRKRGGGSRLTGWGRWWGSSWVDTGGEERKRIGEGMSEDRGSVERTQISLEEREESMRTFYCNCKIANVSIIREVDVREGERERKKKRERGESF